MANRKRKFVLRVPVTPEERALIQEKMAQLGTKNFSAYARKMLIDGYIIAWLQATQVPLYHGVQLLQNSGL